MTSLPSRPSSKSPRPSALRMVCPGGSTPPKKATVASLRKIAAERGVSLGGLTRKADIVMALRVASSPAVPTPAPLLSATTRPSELKQKTIPELKALAATSGVSLKGVTLKADIITALLVATSAVVPRR